MRRPLPDRSIRNGPDPRTRVNNGERKPLHEIFFRAFFFFFSS